MTARSGKSETVLVLEDEDAVRSVVQRILERYGYSVHAVASGSEALRVAREQEGRIDLLLADVILPEMSGPEVAKRIATEWPETRVLFMSGYSENEVFRSGLVGPGTALLRKPFALDEVVRMVRDALDGAPPAGDGLLSNSQRRKGTG